LGVSLGAGIPIKTNKLHVNLDCVSGLDSYSRLNIPPIDTGQEGLTTASFAEQPKPIINFGIGSEFFINKYVNLYTGFSTDFNAIATDSDILDLGNQPMLNSDLGSDYIYGSLRNQLKLMWGNLIVGATHARSTTDFLSPSSIPTDDLNIANDTYAVLSYSRW
jgi:hypothetical protein